MFSFEHFEFNLSVVIQIMIWTYLSSEGLQQVWTVRTKSQTHFATAALTLAKLSPRVKSKFPILATELYLYKIVILKCVSMFQNILN
jgi:hypothetical protein